MNMVRSLGWIGARTRHWPRVGSLVLVLLWVGMAGAQVVTVSDTMDYRDNVWDDEAGVWFMVPNDIEDHTPWYRTSNQDWGWWHNVSALVPSNATGIESATLTINAWDVNHNDGEDDYIYVNSHLVGTLTGVYRAWQTCSFSLPATVLEDLWRDKRAYVFVDIDKVVSLSGGFRVTLGYSTLTVRYTTSGGAALHDWNGDGIVSIVGDVPPFVNCVYFGNCPEWPQERLLGVGDCNADGFISIIGDVPCFVQCVYFGNDCGQ